MKILSRNLPRIFYQSDGNTLFIAYIIALMYLFLNMASILKVTYIDIFKPRLLCKYPSSEHGTKMQNTGVSACAQKLWNVRHKWIELERPGHLDNI